MTGESVWFIDDAPRTRRLLDDFLIMYAYDGRGFENAEDALAALGSGEPAPKAILQRWRHALRSGPVNRQYVHEMLLPRE